MKTQFTQYLDSDTPIMLINDDIGVIKDNNGNVIGGIDGKAWQEEFMYIDSLGKKSIEVRINSAGGSVLEGYNIFSAIDKAKTPTTTHNVGIAASIAGIIFLAGKDRVIEDYGQIMLHAPHSDSDEDVNKQINAVKEQLTTIISSKGKNIDANQYMREETWIDATSAYINGFATKVNVSNSEIKNKLKINLFNYLKKDLYLLNQNTNNMTELEIKKQLDDFKAELLKTLKNEDTATFHKPIPDLRAEYETMKMGYDKAIKDNDDLNKKYDALKKEHEDMKSKMATPTVMDKKDMSIGCDEEEADKEIKNALEKGRIKESEKTAWKIALMANKATINVINALPANITSTSIPTSSTSSTPVTYSTIRHAVRESIKNKKQ